MFYTTPAFILSILLLQAVPGKELLGDIASGGVVVILFVIWWYTFHRANQQYDNSKKEALELFKTANSTSVDLFKQADEHSVKLFQIALQKHEAMNDKLLATIKDGQTLMSEGHRIQENLTGVMSRLETKIDKINSP